MSLPKWGINQSDAARERKSQSECERTDFLWRDGSHFCSECNAFDSILASIHILLPIHQKHVAIYLLPSAQNPFKPMLFWNLNSNECIYLSIKLLHQMEDLWDGYRIRTLELSQNRFDKKKKSVLSHWYSKYKYWSIQNRDSRNLGNVVNAHCEHTSKLEN